MTQSMKIPGARSGRRVVEGLHYVVRSADKLLSYRGEPGSCRARLYRREVNPQPGPDVIVLSPGDTAVIPRLVRVGNTPMPDAVETLPDPYNRLHATGAAIRPSIHRPDRGIARPTRDVLNLTAGLQGLRLTNTLGVLGHVDVLDAAFPQLYGRIEAGFTGEAGVSQIGTGVGGRSSRYGRSSRCRRCDTTC